MLRILFQGDSITDCGRGRDGDPVNRWLGDGYVTMIAGTLLRDGAGYEIRNRAVSGDRISDTFARWIEDTMNVPYDVLSILHGINDVGFGFRLSMGSDRERFAKIYELLLVDSEKTHPNAKLVLMEPFLLPVDRGSDSDFSNDIYLDFDKWYREIRARGAIVEDLAKRHNAIFVSLADDFLEASRRLGPEHYSNDGIHPTAAGHSRIALRWLEACKNILRMEEANETAGFRNDP